MSKRSGSALVIVLLLLVILLGLTLYYLAMVRLEGQTTAAGAARRRVAQDFDTVLVNVQQQIRDSMKVEIEGESEEKWVPYVTSEALEKWASQAEEGAEVVLLDSKTLKDLGWPTEFLSGGGSLKAKEILYDDNMVSLDGAPNRSYIAVAWVAVDLSGLLDPNALEELNIKHLIEEEEEEEEDSPLPEENRVYLSAREFALVNKVKVPVFVPGAFSRDRGWYDEVAHSWRTDFDTEQFEKIPMDPKAWNPLQALAVFTERYPQYTAEELSDLTNAFLDFRDGKEVPTNPLGITAVPVPMFNEVWAKVSVENDGDRVTLTLTLTLEIWRPYPGNESSRSYRVPKTPTIVSPVSIPSGDSDPAWTFEAPFSADVTDSKAFKSLEVTYTRELSGITAESPFTLVVALGGMRIEQVVDQDPGEETELPPTIVDVLPPELILEIANITIPEVGEAAQGGEFGMEVTDPRINHLIGEWKSSSADTLNSINAAALAVPEPRDGFACWTPGPDNKWQAGWIGFLPLPKPWTSVDLFGEDGAWWLKHTRDSGTEFGKWKRGLVNPNSLYVDALSAVWVDAPYEQWPGESGAKRLNVDQAWAVATGLHNHRLRDGGFVHRGDWANKMGVFADPGKNRGLHAEESLVRHALPRLEIAQQLVGIVLHVERRAPGGRVLARRREALIWWRDPYGDPDRPGEGRILWRMPLPAL